MGACVIQISLHFKAAALLLLRYKCQRQIDRLAIWLLNPHHLLVQHRGRRTFLHLLLGMIGILHIFRLNNDIVMLIELIFEISSYSSNRDLGL